MVKYFSYGAGRVGKCNDDGGGKVGTGRSVKSYTGVLFFGGVLSLILT